MSEPNAVGSEVFLPFPPTPDRDSKPYWDALRDGELRLQRCRACSALRWPARALCNRCRSFEADWETQTDPRARIVSWVRTHQVFAPALREAVPYTVVQVALEAQPDLLLIGGWQGLREPRARESVALVIVEGPDGYRLPCWRPLDDEAT
jgi:uncharacterized OB-fold protein